MITLQQFLDKYLGQSKGYPDGSYIGQCLSIVKIYIKECFGIDPPPSGSGSAYGYWSNFPNPLGEKFEKIENNPDLIPQLGWIVIWKPWSANQYGHIAIVADGCTKTILKNYAQNWTSKIFQLESNNYTNVIGFLKPKESIISDMPDIISELIKTNGLTEGDIRWLIDLKNNQTVPNLEKQLADFKELNQEYEVEKQTLLAEIVEYQNQEATWQKDIKTANTKIDKLNETISNITEEKNTWQNRYNNKNSEFNALSDIFEVYKKTHPDEIPKFNLLDFIKSLFKK